VNKTLNWYDLVIGQKVSFLMNDTLMTGNIFQKSPIGYSPQVILVKALDSAGGKFHKIEDIETTQLRALTIFEKLDEKEEEKLGKELFEAERKDDNVALANALRKAYHANLLEFDGEPFLNGFDKDGEPTDEQLLSMLCEPHSKLYQTYLALGK
jgi:hypothetical protein